MTKRSLSAGCFTGRLNKNLNGCFLEVRDRMIPELCEDNEERGGEF